MIRASRPRTRYEELPIRIPPNAWLPEEARFLRAAIAAAEAMNGWWLEKEAIRLENEVKQDD